MKLRGYIIRLIIYLLKYVTCDDDVISRDNYVMMSKQAASWICHIGFQNFLKCQKATEKNENTEKNNKMLQKDLK